MSAEPGDGEPAKVSRRVEAPAETVWSVLADGWTYASWVVGTSRIRRVEREWPAVGARIHHSFGVWPALIDDDTEVLSSDPPRELLLEARGWPAGEAHVRLTLTPDGPDATTVTIEEDVTAGPATMLPEPLRQLAIVPRNKEALRRLAYIAEGRRLRSAGEPAGAGPGGVV